MHAPDPDFWSKARGKFRRGLNRLPETPCGLAQEAGLAAYTVFIGGAREAAPGSPCWTPAAGRAGVLGAGARRVPLRGG